MNFELKIGDKLCTFVAVYRSPSQSQDNFETFIDNFELNLEELSRKNPLLLVAIDDFNAKSRFWYCNDNTTSQEGIRKCYVTIWIASSHKRTNTYFTQFFFVY